MWELALFEKVTHLKLYFNSKWIAFKHMIKQGKFVGNLLISDSHLQGLTRLTSSLPCILIFRYLYV